MTSAGILASPVPTLTTRSRPVLLALLSATLFMAFLDTTVVNVALPDIQRSLHSGVSTLQWVLDAYTLAYAALLLGAGVLTDRIGHRTVLLLGVGLFTLASVGCAVADSGTVLVLARTAQGVGASIVMPVSLSAIAILFPDPGQRATAVGLWSGVGALALAAGPMIGGALVEAFGWASVFWLNVPIGVAVCAGVAVILRSRPGPARPWRLPGQVAFAAGIVLVVLALIEAQRWGWVSVTTLGCLGGGLAVIAIFGWRESIAAEPIVPIRWLRRGDLLAAYLAGAAAFFGLYALTFLLPLLQRTFLGYSVLATGVRFLPVTVSLCVVGLAAGALARRFDPTAVVAAGMFLIAAGLLAVSSTEARPTTALWAGLVAVGVGTALALTPATVLVLSVVDAHESGAAAGMTNVFRQIGGALGVAVAGAVVAGATSGRPALAALDSTDAVDRQAAAEAYFAGFSTTMSVASALCILVGVGLAVLTASARRRRRAT